MCLFGFGVAGFANACFFIYRNAGVVAGFLVKACEGIKQGRFAAIGVAYKGYFYLLG